MNTAKWIIGIIATLVLGYYIVIEKGILNTASEENEQTTTPKAQVLKRYNDDGSLKADVEMVNGIRHGIAHNYYSDGSVHSEIIYKNGTKEGTSTWYYGDGKPYRITIYREGKKHGIQKKYYSNGTVMAEIPYLNNDLQPGTKEYTETGKLIAQTHNYEYSIENKTQLNKTYLITVRGKKLDAITKYVAFRLKDDNKIIFAAALNKNNITFHIPASQSIKGQKINVWLYTKTKMKNKIIIEKQLVIPN